jgi:DNA-binding transcriptional LysR family regulator
MAIKIELLRVFTTVAELGNITDAADKVGRTPSAVSMALKQLEDRIGGALFESDRKTRLTALGEYVLATSRDELLRYDRAIRSMQAFAANRIGRLDMACVPSVASELLPDIIKRFVLEYPGIELDLRDTDSRSVDAAVEKEQVELGIAGRPRAQGPVEFETLFRDRFVVVCASASAVAAGDDTAQWSDLASQALITNGAAAMITAPEYEHMAAQSRLMVRNVTSLFALVRGNVGITFLPELSVPRDEPGLRIVRVAGDPIFREVGLLKRRGRLLSPAAVAFVAELRTELAARVGPDGFLAGRSLPASAARDRP